MGGHRLERAFERLDHTWHVHRLDLKFHPPRLDAREVEDVVDENEQIVARGVDGGGVLHLLGREVAVFVVGEQLGQDEGAVERGSQLVAHVGEKLRLVLVGSGQLVGLLDQIHLGSGQIVALLLKRLSLLFELRVGLLEFRLLSLEARLRFAQGAALLLQFLVADAQLFLLGLQFLSQPLRLLQQLLQLGPVPRRAQR